MLDLIVHILQSFSSDILNNKDKAKLYITQSNSSQAYMRYLAVLWFNNIGKKISFMQKFNLLRLLPFANPPT
jgi:hypothetical protein